uniref:Uncharacterized protein n=1 Tax=Panagrolaimus sp. JU765 TaxID=591449 RepID=A0AC34RI51_9BILA
MLRKPLSQADMKPAKADQVIKDCEILAKQNDSTNSLSNELKSWIAVLEALERKPEDVPSPSEVDSLSKMQQEELWIKVGMVKETIVEEEFNAILNELKS